MGENQICVDALYSIAAIAVRFVKAAQGQICLLGEGNINSTNRLSTIWIFFDWQSRPFFGFMMAS
jgi:hypothetical protein